MPTDDLSRFCCQNPDCDSYGQRGGDNLLVIDHFGKARHRLLYCRACKARFSEFKGTPLFKRPSRGRRTSTTGTAAFHPGGRLRRPGEHSGGGGGCGPSGPGEEAKARVKAPGRGDRGGEGPGRGSMTTGN